MSTAKNTGAMTKEEVQTDKRGVYAELESALSRFDCPLYVLE